MAAAPTIEGKRLGCLVERPPPSSWQYPARGAGRASPRSVLRIPTPSVDQGDLGSCVAQSIKRAIEIIDGRGVRLSALAAYLDVTQASGFSPEEDAGAYPEASVRQIAQGGIGSAALWPYDLELWPKDPPPEYRDQARDHRIMSWFRARQVDQAKAAIEQGYPVMAAFEVPPAWPTLVGADGLWRDAGGTAVGGHMVVIYGYDDQVVGGPGYSPGCFFAVNSWGAWGGPVEQHPHLVGGFRIPYAAFVPGSRFYDALVVSQYDHKAGDEVTLEAMSRLADRLDDVEDYDHLPLPSEVEKPKPKRPRAKRTRPKRVRAGMRWDPAWGEPPDRYLVDDDGYVRRRS